MEEREFTGDGGGESNQFSRKSLEGIRRTDSDLSGEADNLKLIATT